MQLTHRQAGRTPALQALAAIFCMLPAAMGLAATAAMLAGCQRAGTATSQAGAGAESAQGAAPQSEAARTKEMEEKARQLSDKATEIQNMQGTEQEKIDAVNKLEQERQDLNKTGGDGATPAAPPPQ